VGTYGDPFPGFDSFPPWSLNQPSRYYRFAYRAADVLNRARYRAGRRTGLAPALAWADAGHPAADRAVRGATGTKAAAAALVLAA
jgi:hypothetical protein